MKLPSLKIGDLTARIPILQGGMGIGVSLSSLAASVANAGGAGIISTAQIGFEEPDFETNTLEANLRALKKHIARARELSPKGVIGVNILVAMNNYKETVLAAVREKIDFIVSGAGLPIELPELIKNTKTKIIPIVSSGKAAALIARAWDKKYNTAPDAVIIEGPEAGGHLGFSLEQLKEIKQINLEETLADVIKALAPYVEKYKKQIPVIIAGGIYHGKDIARYIKAGASGVQIATRFVPTEECDASNAYKEAYINSTEEDIQIIQSPLGMPGRAIRNNFVKRLEKENIPVENCFGCVKSCNPASTPYCITNALIAAVKGDVENGLIFSGSNAYLTKKIVPVEELMGELVSEAEWYL